MEPRRPIDRQGVGQSGYTAGRGERDDALDRDIQTRHPNYPRGVEDETLLDELETDERWVGKGGPPRAK